MIFKRKIFQVSALLLLPGLLSLGVYTTPVNGEATERQAPEQIQNQTERREAKQGELDEVKKRVCEKRLVNIERIVKNAATHGQKHLQTFSTVTTRVQNFYIEKKLTVANYDELVSKANAKKMAAEAAIQETHSSAAAPSLSCSGANARENLNSLKTNLQTQNSAVKEYRTAIKDLIVAVKQAAQQNRTESEGGTR